jgi:hypothetical protein
MIDSQSTIESTHSDDQQTFNQLVTAEWVDTAEIEFKAKSFPLRRVEGDSRVMHAAPEDYLRLMVLPSALFAGALLSTNEMCTRHWIRSYDSAAH